MTPWERALADVTAGHAPHAAAAALVLLMTPEERRRCLSGDLPFWAGLADMATGGIHRRPFRAATVPRLGIPGLAFSDGPRGVVVGTATCFPVSMARGATWDLDLEERIGEAIGIELRTVGANLFGGVCVNILRHPAWGRAQETYGEDPHHVGEFGAALTRGVQRHVMATVKHFAANSMENARFQVDVTIANQALHEVYLPHFKRVVQEGVACVMTAYNSLNGEWCGQSPALISDVLRTEWGFEGLVISDWIFGVRDAAASINAGLDLEMPGPMIRHAGLDAALASGDTTWAAIDACVTRTLAALLHQTTRTPSTAPDHSAVAGPGHRALAREAAAKSIVLLRNEPIDGAPLLPLAAASLTSVAVFGAWAAMPNLGDSGSSDVNPPHVVTPLEGLVAALPQTTVVLQSEPAAAAGSDVAIVVVGYTSADEGEYVGYHPHPALAALLPGADDPDEAAAFTAVIAAETASTFAPRVGPEGIPGRRSVGGDRTSLRLSPADEALIAAVVAINPRTIVAVVAGSAVIMEAWRHQVPAIVQLWYSGMEGGHGLADVLLGRTDASGRLPFTVPTDARHLPPFDRSATTAVYDGWHGYWRLARDRHAAAYPFGFGLSYTAWALGPTTVDEHEDHLVVQATVRNLGSREGADVVQVYAGRPADATRPARRLVAFARVSVPAHRETVAEIRIPWSALAVRQGDAWLIAAGTYVLTVGRHSADLDAVDLIIDRP